MKTQFKLTGIIAVIIVIFILIGCDKQPENPFEVISLNKSLPICLEESAAAEMELMSTPDCYIETDLWADAGGNDLSKGTLVGNVLAFAWGDFVYVKYHILKENCYLVDVHAYISDEKPSTAAPGQFAFEERITEPYTTSYMFQIPWKEKGWQCETVLYIAAHATVCCGDQSCGTAWAYGNYSFVEEGISKKWGWFFDLTLCCHGD